MKVQRHHSLWLTKLSLRQTLKRFPFGIPKASDFGQRLLKHFMLKFYREDAHRGALGVHAEDDAVCYLSATNGPAPTSGSIAMRPAWPGAVTLQVTTRLTGRKDRFLKLEPYYVKSNSVLCWKLDRRTNKVMEPRGDGMMVRCPRPENQRGDEGFLLFNIALTSPVSRDA